MSGQRVAHLLGALHCGGYKVFLLCVTAKRSPPPSGFKGEQGSDRPLSYLLQRQNKRNVALLAPRKQFGKVKRLSEFLNLIANTFLFRGCSFGVRQHVAALEGGAVAPHSKKWRFQGRVSAHEVWLRRLRRLAMA